MYQVRASVEPAANVLISINDADVRVTDGAMLAAALLSAGYRTLRRSPREGGARGAFCFMGVCQECLVLVDGVPQQACRVAVRPGMRVTLDSQTGLGAV